MPIIIFQHLHKRKFSTKYFGEMSYMVASRLDRAQSLWLYSDGLGPVHGYRSQHPLVRCSRENLSDAHLSRGKMLAGIQERAKAVEIKGVALYKRLGMS